MGSAIALLGLFSGERFSYARALYNPLSPISVVVERVARELACFEGLDRSYRAFVEGLGEVEIFGVCRVDRAIVNGAEVDVVAVLHVAKVLEGKPQFDAVLGRDLGVAWGLYVDPLTNSVKSLYGKPVERRY